MQHPIPELFMAQKQADIQRELEHDKLVREAKSTKNPIQGWIVEELHLLSLWMIITGERLHKHCHSTTNIQGCI
jgi:Ni,Fe-hydrogenase I cytochrome b subunit